jgi:mRNA interferase MazF
MAGQSPRQGWVYMINPHRVSLRCSQGHQHIYNLNLPGELICKASLCSLMMNSSRVFRGTHPYIIWTSDQFQDDSKYIQTFAVIPLTSQTTFAGLPTTYPITSTSSNGLSIKSYALTHQVYTVDGNCLKDSDGNWLSRDGQLDKKDKAAIMQRLKYFLGCDNNPTEDWFRKSATPELIQKIYGYLPAPEKARLLEELIDGLS